jgi:hypothetical protein
VIPTEIDETARLILMDRPAISLLNLARAVREYHPETDALTIGNIWAKYRGFDGRTQPTHDVQTGERL